MVFTLIDPGIKADVDSWKLNLANYSSQYVGETLVYLNGTFEECRFRECNLGNLICDAMVSTDSTTKLVLIGFFFLSPCLLIDHRFFLLFSPRCFCLHYI